VKKDETEMKKKRGAQLKLMIPEVFFSIEVISKIRDGCLTHLKLRSNMPQGVSKSLRPRLFVKKYFFLKNKFWESEFQESELFSDVW
jgi:hypothetical protein